MKKYIWGIIAVAVIIIIVGLVRSNSNSDSTLRIGVIAPLSGPVADYGEEIRKGILDVASITPDAQFVFEDDKCDPKSAVSAFQKLNGVDKVSMILGPACGSPQEAVVPLLKNDSAVLLVMSAASNSLYAQSNNNFFNIQYSLEDESAFNGQMLNQLGYKKVALVTYQNAFSDAHAKAFKAAYKGQIFDHVLLDATSNVSSEAAKIKAEKPDAIYAPDISFFFANGLAKLKQFGVTVPIYSTYVAELPAVRSLVPDVFYSFPGSLTSSQGAVFELSRQAAEMAVEAVKKCGASVPCIRDEFISSGNFDSTGVYKRQLILKQIKDGKPVVVQQ